MDSTAVCGFWTNWSQYLTTYTPLTAGLAIEEAAVSIARTGRAY